MNDLVIILTRYANKQSLITLYKVIANTGMNVIIMEHNGNTKLEGIEIVPFNDDDLLNSGLNYWRSNIIIPGSNNLPLLYYWNITRKYDHIWMIEDDVYFSGDWSDFFKQFVGMQDDFITSNIRRYNTDPSWSWWDSMYHPSKAIRKENLIASFNPVYRLSSRAMQHLYNAYFEGWTGHHEVVMASLLSNSGFSISDFGGHGVFVSKGFEALFYNNNYWNNGQVHNVVTYRYRPIFEYDSIFGSMLQKNKLYHPVK